MKQVNVKKLILPNIPYVFIALLATKVSEAVRLAPGSDASTKLLNIMTGLNTAFHSLVPSFHPIDLCVGVAAAIAIRLAVYIKGKNAKKFRKNLEYGSARWGTAEDIKPYVDPAFENNIIEFLWITSNIRNIHTFIFWWFSYFTNKCKYEPCEALNHYANELMTREP